jgi:hypothetical protein
MPPLPPDEPVLLWVIPHSQTFHIYRQYLVPDDAPLEYHVRVEFNDLCLVAEHNSTRLLLPTDVITKEAMLYHQSIDDNHEHQRYVARGRRGKRRKAACKPPTRSGAFSIACELERQPDHRNYFDVTLTIYLRPRSVVEHMRSGLAPLYLTTLLPYLKGEPYTKDPIDFGAWELPSIPRTNRYASMVARLSRAWSSTSAILATCVAEDRATTTTTSSSSASQPPPAATTSTTESEDTAAVTTTSTTESSGDAAAATTTSTTESEGTAATTTTTKSSNENTTVATTDLRDSGVLAVAPLAPCIWAPTAQPRGLIGKQLFEYQLTALTWMRHIEEHAAKGFPFAIDFPNRQRLRELEIDEAHFADHFSSRGAILGDEMGLGKTIEMISLILCNRKPKVPRDGTFIARRQALYESGLTLVVCPSHLVAQWESEIKSCSALRTCTICTPADWEVLTYDHLLTQCDVVIMSHAFLRNSTYSAACGLLSHIHDFSDAQAKGIDPTSVVRRSRRSTVAAKDSTVKGLSTDATKPILQRIGWHRIILDEGHELVADATTHHTTTSKVGDIEVGSVTRRGRRERERERESVCVCVLTSLCIDVS